MYGFCVDDECCDRVSVPAIFLASVSVFDACSPLVRLSSFIFAIYTRLLKVELLVFSVSSPLSSHQFEFEQLKSSSAT